MVQVIAALDVASTVSANNAPHKQSCVSGRALFLKDDRTRSTHTHIHTLSRHPPLRTPPPTPHTSAHLCPSPFTYTRLRASTPIARSIAGDAT
jgi:hypothetical protein